MATGTRERSSDVTVRFQLSLGLAGLGSLLATAPTLALLIPTQVDRLAPGRSVTDLGIVTAAGAASAMVGGVLWGAVSDRMTWRLGRRRTVVAAGILAAVLCLGLVAEARDVLTLTLSWIGVQLGVSAVQAGTAAVVPDIVPQAQRGKVSAILGIDLPAALLIGSVLLGVVIAGVRTGYTVIAILAVTFCLPFLWSYREQPLVRRTPRPPLNRQLRDLWVSPRRHPDFALAWISRFAIVLGYELGVGSYLFFFVEHILRYQHHFPGHPVKQGVALLMVIGVLFLVPAAVGSGIASDRRGRRKGFVVLASACIAGGLGLMTFFTTWGVAQIAAALIGVGFGAYLAVDTALITQVLPSADDHGKDLGIMNLTNTLPPALAPVLGALLINGFGKSSAAGYHLLFGLGAALAITSAVIVQRIRSVD